MTNVSIDRETLATLIEMADSWHARHVGGQSCAPRHTKALREAIGEYNSQAWRNEPS